MPVSVRMLCLSTLKGLWSVSDAGLDTSKERSRHQFSKALAFNAVPPRSNNNNTYSVTIVSVYHLKFKCMPLCLAESAPSFVCYVVEGERSADWRANITGALLSHWGLYTLTGVHLPYTHRVGWLWEQQITLLKLGGGFGMLCWVVGTTHLAEVVARSQRAPSVIAEMVCFCFGMCCSGGSEVWSKSLLANERQHFLL